MHSSTVKSAVDLRCKAVLCFQHCQTEAYITCFTVPTVCPQCRQSVTGPGSTPLRVPPFVVPSPFVNSFTSPLCVVVRPTTGTFLSDYTSDSDLHVGVTDSFGVVYHYDCNGIQCSLEGWSECLAVPVLSSTASRLHSLWSSLLTDICRDPSWTQYVYSETEHNCYDFVFSFLRLLLLHQSSSASNSDGGEEGWRFASSVLTSKSYFCKEAVLPVVRRAERYIALYRRLTREHVVISDARRTSSGTATGSSQHSFQTMCDAIVDSECLSTVF